LDKIRLSRGADHIVASPNFAPLLSGLFSTRLRKIEALRVDASTVVFVNNRDLQFEKYRFLEYYVLYVYVCIYTWIQIEGETMKEKFEIKHENFQDLNR